MKSKNNIFNNQGSTLVIVLMLFAIFSILGIVIVNIATSEQKMTKIDGRKQSAFYIAESGINYMIDKIDTVVKENSNKYETSADFFLNIRHQLTGNTTLDDFEKNNGEQPKAIITVSHVSTDESTSSYKIESVGKVGDSTRTVSSMISIGWSKQKNDGILGSLLFYAKNFSFNGSSVNAHTGSIVMDGIETHNLNGGAALNVSNLYFNGPVNMNGGSASFGSIDEPGNIYVNGGLELWEGARNVYGDIKVHGKFKLKDAKIHGNVYVNGDLELGWTPEIEKNIYYTGELIAPPNFDRSLLSKCIKVDKVDSFEIPIVNFGLREDNWYTSNGYVIKGHETATIPHDAKMLVDNYENTSWQKITGQVVIVSKGDIILRGGNGFTGALIAPYGEVKYSGDGTFNGIIISNNVINLPQGGNYFNFKSLEELFGDDIPVITDNSTGGENGSGNSGTVDVEITTQSIKEE